MANIVTKIFGSANDRNVRRMLPIVEEINIEFEKLKSLSDSDFPKKTEEFKKRYQDGETLDDLMVEAFAVVKEACRRMVGRSWLVTEHEWKWEMVPFDVQLMGAIVLHQGKIAEMATGEGKTLVSTMPLYLNSLTGNGCHLITVNDYLAKRDSEWNGGVYNFLGLKVGCIQEGMNPEERKPHYDADITYGTNNQFGFDYLRDNMVWRMEDKVQRGHNYAIVDEVDSVLIDEARTPLIISGPVEHIINKEYANLKPLIERQVVHRQTIFANQMLSDAEKLLAEGKDEEAGKKLVIVQQGAPKNNKLLKLKKDSKILRLVEESEKRLMADELAQKTSIRKEVSEFHKLKEELYYIIDEKGNSINITEKGRQAIAPGNPDFFTLPDLSRELPAIDKDSTLSPREKFVAKQAVEREYAEVSEKLHVINQLLKAYSLFAKDVEYVIQNNKVIIVDEFTGRLMPGRRYSDGLHQALEAKEDVQVEAETQTLATITLQNYFRMYKKLAGMTGTALTEASEFWDIYKLDVVTIPTNKPVRREEYQDVVFKTKKEKYDAIMKEVEEMHKIGRPVLLGTTSVEVSETIARMLKRRGIPLQVLNARYHQQEAEIISLAGQTGKVTIATNMADRGTDIKLDPGVPELGGLHVIGSERHESRRVDNQLKGRCARQGDKGSSRFYLSLEDNLMRLFGSDRMAGAMARWGPKEGEPIEHRFISRAIEGAQKRVELWHFDIRKHALEYDDVLNYQRNAIYSLRDDVLEGKDLSEKVREIIGDIVDEIIDKHAQGYSEAWDWDGLFAEIRELFLLDFSVSMDDRVNMVKEELEEKLKEVIFKLYVMREEQIGAEEMRGLERQVLLHVIDRNWIDHLYELDALKEGIGLRGYAQRDPLVEYKKEAYDYFEEFLSKVNYEITRNLFGLRFKTENEKKLSEMAQRARAFKPDNPTLQPVKPQEGTQGAAPSPAGMPPGMPGGVPGRPFEVPDEMPTIATYKRQADKVGRNDPCPCGSGKKYKNCCGKA